MVEQRLQKIVSRGPEKAGFRRSKKDLPLKRENMTKKKGRVFEMTVKLGAKAHIHCPQLAWKRKKSTTIR